MPLRRGLGKSIEKSVRQNSHRTKKTWGHMFQRYQYFYEVCLPLNETPEQRVWSWKWRWCLCRGWWSLWWPDTIRVSPRHWSIRLGSFCFTRICFGKSYTRFHSIGIYAGISLMMTWFLYNLAEVMIHWYSDIFKHCIYVRISIYHCDILIFWYFQAPYR